jgi:hypothetical protein
MATKFSYVGKYADGGSRNSFYKLSGKPYGFKSFPNKSLAEFAHSIQSHLSPYAAPKVYSPVCKIRIPNYFVDGMENNKIKYRTEMVLSDWGYLTEIAKQYVCYDNDCDGDCAHCGLCSHYDEIGDLLNGMWECGVEYTDCHEGNFGWVKRGKKKILVAIDFGRESIGETEGDFPEVCWEGVEGAYCNCPKCEECYV